MQPMIAKLARKERSIPHQGPTCKLNARLHKATWFNVKEPLAQRIARMTDSMIANALLMGEDIVWIDKTMYLLRLDIECQWIDIAKYHRETRVEEQND